MRASDRAPLAAVALIPLLACVATADTWIDAVRPRLVGRGRASEIVINGWRNEATDVLFYPQATFAPWTAADQGSRGAVGIRCVGTTFDAAKDRLVCTLEVAPDCRPGEHPFRVVTAAGLSSMGTVYVSPFPVIDEAEANPNTNDSTDTALRVEKNVTVYGNLHNGAGGDVDCFRVAGKAGERLSVEVDMVKMGDDLVWNPVPEGYDSVVTVLDPSGKRIAMNDDSALNRQDPLLSIKVPGDGDYTIVLRRSMFVPHTREYAIHLGGYFRPLAAYPPGGPAGGPLAVNLLGDPLGSVPQTVAVPQAAGTFPLAGEAPLPLSLRSSPYPNLLEEQGAAETKVPTTPVALNGILSKPDETDRFRLMVKKGAPLQVRVWASGLGLPVDPVIRLRPIDAAGAPGEPEFLADDASLADRDIFGAQGDFPELFDPSVIWTPKQDGDYLLEISDSRGAGGPTSVYRVEIAPPANTLHVGLQPTPYQPERPRTTSLSVPAGGRWNVRLMLYAGQGSTIRGPFDLAVEGLPAGVKLVSPRVPEMQSVWPLAFEAASDAPLAASFIRVSGRPVDGGEPFETVNQQNLLRVRYSHYPWRSIRVDRFAAVVTEPAGFGVELVAPKQPLMRGSEVTIPVRIVRQPGFDEPLEMQCEIAPSGVAVSPAELIPSGESEAKLTLSADASAKLGQAPMYVMVTTTQARG
ncbi:MAG: PPC domain-containing protein, partial [Planctomycetaceae bacterium]